MSTVGLNEYLTTGFVKLTTLELPGLQKYEIQIEEKLKMCPMHMTTAKTNRQVLS